MSNIFDFKLVFAQIPDLLEYLPITLELAFLSMALGLIIGLILALLKIRNVPVLKSIATFFISLIRGTPVLVQLYIAYFGIPMLFKWLNLRYGTDFKVADVDFCVDMEGIERAGIETAVQRERRDIRLVANARNASGIELIDLNDYDESDDGIRNKCMPEAK